MKSFKVKNAVLCEDIRTENNGKQLLIGVYLNDIRLSVPSAKISLAFWLQLAGFEEGETELNFRVRLDRKTLGDGHVKLSVTEPDESVTVPIRPQAFNLEVNRTLHFDLKFRDASRWKTILSSAIRPQ